MDAGPAPADASRGSKYAAAVMADQPAAYWRMDDRALGDGGIVLVNQVTSAPEGTYQAGSLSLGERGALGPGGGTALGLNRGLYALGRRYGFVENARFTIELWLRVTDDAMGHVVTKQDRGDPKSGYAVYAAKGQVTFERFVNNGNVKVTAPAPMSESYAHVAAVYDGAFLRLYVNGESADENDDPTSMPETNAELLLGGSRTLGAGIEYPLAGTIDELAIYERALGPDPIKAHFLAAAP